MGISDLPWAVVGLPKPQHLQKPGSLGFGVCESQVKVARKTGMGWWGMLAQREPADCH